MRGLAVIPEVQRVHVPPQIPCQGSARLRQFPTLFFFFFFSTIRSLGWWRVEGGTHDLLADSPVVLLGPEEAVEE